MCNIIAHYIYRSIYLIDSKRKGYVRPVSLELYIVILIGIAKLFCNIQLLLRQKTRIHISMFLALLQLNIRYGYFLFVPHIAQCISELYIVAITSFLK